MEIINVNVSDVFNYSARMQAAGQLGEETDWVTLDTTDYINSTARLLACTKPYFHQFLILRAHKET